MTLLNDIHGQDRIDGRQEKGRREGKIKWGIREGGRKVEGRRGRKKE